MRIIIIQIRGNNNSHYSNSFHFLKSHSQEEIRISSVLLEFFFLTQMATNVHEFFINEFCFWWEEIFMNNLCLIHGYSRSWTSQATKVERRRRQKINFCGTVVEIAPVKPSRRMCRDDSG